MDAVIRAAVVAPLLTCLVGLVGGRAAIVQTSTDACTAQVESYLDGVMPPTVRLPSQVVNLKTALGQAPYRDAFEAAGELLRRPELAYGKPLAEVMAILGRPDLMFVGEDRSVQLYYNTNGGPLDLAFQRCALIHKGVNTPARWRGTDAELAALWSKARRSREWWLWEPMTGALSPVEGSRGDQAKTATFEVDLDGGMFGDTGALSFSLGDKMKCRGRWSASSGSGLAVTRGQLLAKYGPLYFPGTTDPSSPGPHQRLGRAAIDCDGGHSFRLEFVTGVGTAHGWGIGQDDQGAIYRFTF